MSQRLIERLRDYLAQLPPQSQALLMREFERAVERGEDINVATLVLEQLRKIVRRAEEEEMQPRGDDPARLLFHPLEPFLAEGNFPIRPGQIRRASLMPIWQWLGREGAPEATRDFEAALAKAHDSGATSAAEAAARKYQLAAADIAAQAGREIGQIVQSDRDGHAIGRRGDADLVVGRRHLDREADDLPRRDQALHHHRQREGKQLWRLQRGNVERRGHGADPVLR